MSNIQNQNQENQEIDLSLLTKKISGFFDSVLMSVFKSIQFVKKNIIVVGVLFVLGATLGYFMDESTAVYDQEIIVAPNFGSVDYLYSKIDLLNSKLKNNDTIFLKSIGIKKPKKIISVSVEPVVDIYTFVNNNTVIATNAQNTQNFELVKLLSEDGDIKKVIKDKLTSKNYAHHTILIKTDGYTIANESIDPILKYLNQSEYFQNYQKVSNNNTVIKIQQNNIIIAQIDGLLNEFSTTTAGNQKNDKLVYYNENTQLNDIIQTKNTLISENGYQKLQLVNLDKIIKEICKTVNIKNTTGTNNKMKLILPILFLFLFVCYRLFKSFYKKQESKYSNI
ncbi:MAG: hypothetical protein H7174_07045 [Flavobacterium sp.]|nr:hypothetical protein [Flavobacterium sp.]